MDRALLIVDMQNDYFPGGKMELVGIKEACDNVGRVLAMFRAKEMPIFLSILKNFGVGFLYRSAKFIISFFYG